MISCAFSSNFSILAAGVERWSPGRVHLRVALATAKSMLVFREE